MKKVLFAVVLSAGLTVPVSVMAQEPAPVQNTAPTVVPPSSDTAAPMTKGQMKDQRAAQKAQEKSAKENAKAAKENSKALQHQDKATNAAEKARASQPAAPVDTTPVVAPTAPPQ